MDVWYLRLEAPEKARLDLTEVNLRRIIRSFARLDELVLFAVTPKAIHLVARGDVQRAGRVSASTLLTIRPLIAAELALAYRQRLKSRGHLLRYVERLLVEYLEEEGVETHPALWSGSCFPELIGARAVDGLSLKLGAIVPQYRTRSAYKIVGLPRQKPLKPLVPGWLRSAGATRIVTAVASAAAVGPPTTPLERTIKPAFPDNTKPMVAARRATVTLARIAAISWSEISWSLKISQGSARKIAGRPVDWPLVHAAAVRLALEDELRRSVFLAPRHLSVGL